MSSAEADFDQENDFGVALVDVEHRETRLLFALIHRMMEKTSFVKFYAHFQIRPSFLISNIHVTG